MKTLLSLFLITLFTSFTYSQVYISCSSFEMCKYDTYSDDLVDCSPVEMEVVVFMEFENSTISLFIGDETKVLHITEMEDDGQGSWLFQAYDNDDPSIVFVVIFNEEEYLLVMIPEDYENEISYKFNISSIDTE
ncbi:MAG: hypothetical protein IAE91_12160 [Ignavibacteriaceae bacterium]|nr:hypothetical protein [Ignavibacteriaceae bacterium]